MAAKTQVVHIAVDNAEITATSGLPVELTGTNTVSVSGSVAIAGAAAHDAPVSGNPVLVAGYASAAAPVAVSGDGDATQAWYSLNGAQCVQLTNAGALIPGDATDGLTVNLGTNNDVTVSGTTTTQDTANLVDNAGFTDGTSRVIPAGYIYDEAAGTALTENDVAAARVNINRAQIGIIEDGVTRARYATVTASNALKIDGSAATQPVSGTVTASNAAGDVAHDTADSGNPVKVGAKAIAHGTNPTAVTANDRTDLYANRHGILFTIGGHPNTVTRSARIAAADGAQTNASLNPSIGAGEKMAVTAISVTCDADNTVNVACKIGFGTASIIADSTTGAVGVLLDHEGIAPGSGIVIGNGGGILGIGADDEELRLTCDVPTTGAICVTYSYFTIAS